ncbi:TatD family hydrolase [Candidatus Saccharibacteria bacterium]|nr:TatD family hydrolase [Candidatus Saccharibacteria bacterium]
MAKTAPFYLIDTHCHLHDLDFPIPPAEALEAAAKNQVQKMIFVGTSPADSLRAKSLANQHQNTFWSYGYHPNEFRGLLSDFEADLKRAKDAGVFDDKNLVAIGEIGLDYHYAGFDRAAQIALLERTLQLAQDLKLPVSFHVRDAFVDFWPIFDNYHLKPSVLHSFSDSKANLAEALNRNLYIGTNGLSTFADLPHPSLDRIILETDAPYLAPKPHRGKPNQPAYIKNIADWAAAYYSTDLESVAKTTTATAETIFALS